MTSIEWIVVLLLVVVAGVALNWIFGHWAELVDWLERPVELL